MRSVGDYIKPYAGRMAAGLVIKLIGTVMDLVLPYLLATVIDDVVPTGSVSAVYRYGALMVLCALVAVSFNVTANRMAARVSKTVVERLRYDLFSRISYLSSAGLDRFSVPSLISRLSTDTYNVHTLLDRMQRMGVRAPMLMLGGMLLTFLLEPSLALVLLFLAPLLFVTVYFVSKYGVPLYAAVQRRVEGLVRTVRENASGVRVIRALSKADYERARFDGANAGVAEAETRAGRVMAVTNPTMSLLLNAGLMLVVVIGARRVDRGLLQPGTIIAFLSYFTIILNAMLTVTRIFVLWSRGSASAARITEVLNAPEEQPVAAAARVPTPDHIVFEDVCFSYGGKRDNLSHISFSLPRGGTLGLFGPTGAGKTTLVSLLMRFYDADRGRILIGGRPVTSIPREELAGMFGVVFQNDTLLTDTVYENISFLRGLSEADVLRAAKTAQADFIEALPGGLQYRLDIRGANLSGGQRQRLLIARALAGNPGILVLDDAESALDYRTDARLRAAIRQSYPGATAVVISERVSAIKNADCILVLDDGRMLDCGTHGELMARCEHYRRIADVQMGGAGA